MKRLMLLVWMLLMLPDTLVIADGKIVFSFPDIHGKVHTQSEYAGKWVVVNYWATSCGPCLKEIPELVAFHKRHQDRDIVLLGVDFEDIQLSWLQDFMDSVSINYTVLRSDTSQETPFGTLVALPTTFIVSPAGELVAHQTGAVTAADLEAYISRKSQAARGGSPSTKNNIKIH